MVFVVIVIVANLLFHNNNNTIRRLYYTNGDKIKESDPYAKLGLTWGATNSEIKFAYHKLAHQLHPDVSKLDPTVAIKKFRAVREAYDILMNTKKNGINTTENDEQWAFQTWRTCDIIAQQRTDVAGAMRKRPSKPAISYSSSRLSSHQWGIATIGHPDGRGVVSNSNRRQGEYLSSGETIQQRSRTSTSVGTGISKWVTKKEFRPWIAITSNDKNEGVSSTGKFRTTTCYQNTKEEKE
jgi:curved DNA-binding protein CbpA